MPTPKRVPDPTVPVPSSSLDAARKILIPLDDLLKAAAKDDLMDRARPDECTAIRRSGDWLRDTVVKLLDTTRPHTPPPSQNGKAGR
jgi:hypothetical protein